MTDPRDFPSDKADKFVVRLPDGMRERIKEAAVRNGRSANAEIVHRLEQTFEMDERIAESEKTILALSEDRPAKSPEEKIEEWADRLKRTQDYIEHLVHRQDMFMRFMEAEAKKAQGTGTPITKESS